MKSLFEVYFSKLLLMAISFCTNILIARHIGPEGVGHFALIMVAGILLSTLLSFGMETSLLYFSSKYPEASSKLFKFGLKYTLFVSLIAGGASIIASKMGLYSNEDANYIISIMALTMLQSFVISIKIGKGHLLGVNQSLIVVNVIYLLSVVFLTERLSLSYHSILFMYSLTCIVFIVFALRGVLGGAGRSRVEIAVNALFSYSFRSYVGSLSGVLRLRIPVIMISIYCSSFDVGIYSTSQSLIESFYIFPVILSSLLVPVITSCTEESARSNITLRYAKLAFFTSLCVVIMFNLFCELIIVKAYGVEFHPAVRVSGMLSVGAVLYGVTKILMSYFTGIGRPGITSILEFTSLAILIVLLCFLAPRYGIIGVSYSVIFSFLALLAMSLFAFKRLAKIEVHKIFFMSVTDFKYLLGLLKGKFT